MLSADDNCVFESGKVFTHAIGLSCAFRQWRADSHCRFLHGYSLQVTLTFRAKDLDVRNWVVDFGSLKDVKGFLENQFDHKTIVALDDPKLAIFRSLDEQGLIQLRTQEHVGMEACAYYIFQIVEQWLHDAGYGDRCSLQEVEVREHEANFARYRRIN